MFPNLPLKYSVELAWGSEIETYMSAKYLQKSPVYPQKSPIYPQKSPMYQPKSPIYLGGREGGAGGLDLWATSELWRQMHISVKRPVYLQKSPIASHRSRLKEYIAVTRWRICRAFLWIHRALFWIYRALFWIYRTLLQIFAGGGDRIYIHKRYICFFVYMKRVYPHKIYPLFCGFKGLFCRCSRKEEIID